MGKRALMFIPNTPALVAWGQKPTTRHLSNLINGRTEGNILNSKALLSAYEQVFSVQDHKCEFTQKLHLWSIHPL